MMFQIWHLIFEKSQKDAVDGMVFMKNASSLTLILRLSDWGDLQANQTQLYDVFDSTPSQFPEVWLAFEGSMESDSSK